MKLHDPLQFTPLALPVLLFATFFFGLHGLRADGIDEKPKTWGLAPHHVDRGLDRLDLDDSVRSLIEECAEEYHGERARMRSEIVALRHLMVGTHEEKRRERLPEIRSAIRERMRAMRQIDGDYVATVSDLLEDDQISRLLDMELAWGE